MTRGLFFFLFLFYQSVHSSFTGMECFPDKGTIRVSLKLDMTDFIHDYRLTIDDDHNFDPSGSIDTSVIFLRNYIAGRLQIISDGKNLKGNIVKLQTTENELNVGLVYNYNPKIKSFTVKNTILNGYYKNLSNLLIFKYREYEEGIKLTTEIQEHVFKVE